MGYELVATECPLDVGWDLFDSYLDEIRCVLAEEENLERALIDESAAGERIFEHVEACKVGRLELESEFEKWQRYRCGSGGDRLCGVDATLVQEEDAPLHTKTIPNEVVRKEVAKWIPSMVSEYESLVRENDAVEPFPEETLEQWKREGREFELVPGKTVHTIKAFTGRLKSRAVICGNFLGQTFSKEQKYAAGADSVLIRILLRMVALMSWSLCVMDVRTAFLLAPLLFQEDRPTLVQVPKLFLMGGVCKENYLASEEGLIWHGDFSSLLGSVSEQNPGRNERSRPRRSCQLSPLEDRRLPLVHLCGPAPRRSDHLLR